MKLLSHPFDDTQCARLPAARLSTLAALRCEPGIEVAFIQDHAYVRWRPGDEQVVRALFPHPACEFFVRQGEHWHLRGRTLPELGFPTSLEYRPLYQVVVPAPVVPAGIASAELVPCPVRLIEDQVPRPTRGLRCPLANFADWAEQVPGCALEKLQGVVHGAGIFVLGSKLPWIPREHKRYWGQRMLAPIGFRPAPALVESELRAAAEVAEDDLLILHADGWEVIQGELFSPLSHAALRLASADAHSRRGPA